MKILISLSNNDLELAGYKLRQLCAKLKYAVKFEITEKGLHGEIKTRYDVIDFVLRFIETKSGISLGHYRVDILKSENDYKIIKSGAAQGAVQDFLTEIAFKTGALCANELEDEESEIEEHDVHVNTLNEPLQGGMPVVIDGFSNYW